MDPADDDRLRGLLTLIAGTVSYLHIHTLVEAHGSAGLGAGADPVLGLPMEDPETETPRMSPEDAKDAA